MKTAAFCRSASGWGVTELSLHVAANSSAISMRPVPLYPDSVPPYGASAPCSPSLKSVAERTGSPASSTVHAGSRGSPVTCLTLIFP